MRPWNCAGSVTTLSTYTYSSTPSPVSDNTRKVMAPATTSPSPIFVPLESAMSLASDADHGLSRPAGAVHVKPVPCPLGSEDVRDHVLDLVGVVRPRCGA